MHIEYLSSFIYAACKFTGGLQQVEEAISSFIAFLFLACSSRGAHPGLPRSRRYRLHKLRSLVIKSKLRIVPRQYRYRKSELEELTARSPPSSGTDEHNN